MRLLDFLARGSSIGEIPTIIKLKPQELIDEEKAVCDRCHNLKSHSRKRQPIDPDTFCDDCHEETGL